MALVGYFAIVCSNKFLTTNFIYLKIIQFVLLIFLFFFMFINLINFQGLKGFGASSYLEDNWPRVLKDIDMRKEQPQTNNKHYINMKFVSSTLFALACALTSSFAAADDECKQITVKQDFDYDTYASKPWYIQSQMVTRIATPSDFFCVRARFRLLDEPLNGYSIGVLAEKREDSVTGVLTVNDLCSFSDPSDPAKLVLSRCDVPSEEAGDYWIVRYNEEAGYAIISGGQPTIPSGRGDGLCQTGTGVTQSGLYIFTREQKKRREARTESYEGCRGSWIRYIYT